MKAATKVRRSQKSKQLKYGHHKARNKGFISYPKGRHHKRYQEWLPGPHNSPESLEAFEHSLGYYLSHGDVPPWVLGDEATPPGVYTLPAGQQTPPPAKPPARTTAAAGDGEMTVAELCEKFSRRRLKEFCHSERCLYKVAMRRLCHEVGRRPAASIGVEELEDVRELFKDAGNCLRTINGQITRIRAIFDYGVARKYFPAYVARDLKALPRLTKGRVNKAIKPVPEDVFQQTRQHMPAEAQDLVDVLWHSGARSGELFKLRVEDLQPQSGKLWTYELEEHKTSMYGHERVIFFGPESVAILRRLIKGKKPSELVFTRPPQTDYRNKTGRWKTGGTAWSRDALGKLISRICKAHEIPRWHPHQIRHAFGTPLYNAPGGSIAGTQALLGHARATTTSRYAKADTSVAERLAKHLG